ncbi:MAG: HlyD family efflux transporter periplasmic adaptor subunit [Bacteroidales bacterium]|nr:HlyD family efflux transporter periplasmic adaptor subunit [Bacteroidales bacterium]
MKKRWYFVIAIVVVIVAIIIYSTSGKESVVEVTAVVDRGAFDIVVSTTGELQALNSTDIRGPEDLREVRVHSVKIVDLIPEGTIVKAGDYVATLDRSEATQRLQSQADDLISDEAAYNQTLLDTTITLLDYRNKIKDLEYGLEEKQIVLDQSQYEPPATIRQAEMNLDRAKRAYEQALVNYKLKEEQTKSQVRRAKNRLDDENNERAQLMHALEGFEIYAPQSGMVIYKKEWGGAKRKVGSSISAWDPVVATLPDLTVMISKTYVNEIDISKLDVGQKVKVGVDAFPDHEYTGTVMEVANVGEQLSTSDAKVFEVVIKINESDSILRPAMTTVNEVLTGTYNDVLFIPLESVHSTDSMSYVLTVKSKKRQIVDLGKANENFIIVKEGLDESEEVFLTIPEGSEDWEYSGWDIYEKLKQRKIEEDRIKKEEAAQRRKQMENELKQREELKKFNMENLPADQRKKLQQMMQKNGGGIQVMRGGSQGSGGMSRGSRSSRGSNKR